MYPDGGSNLSNIFDKIAPKSKEDIQRKRERQMQREDEARYGGTLYPQNNYNTYD